MSDANRQSGAGQDNDAAPDLPDAPSASAPDTPPPPAFDESLVEELAALIDDGRTYAQAELAFQKTRARLTGKAVGVAAASAVVGIILLHIAFLALAVGLVMALAPLVTIWGAIAIVVGVLLLLVGVLAFVAVKNGKKIAAMFGGSDKDGEE